MNQFILTNIANTFAGKELTVNLVSSTFNVDTIAKASSTSSSSEITLTTAQQQQLLTILSRLFNTTSPETIFSGLTQLETTLKNITTTLSSVSNTTLQIAVIVSNYNNLTGTPQLTSSILYDTGNSVTLNNNIVNVPYCYLSGFYDYVFISPAANSTTSTDYIVLFSLSQVTDSNIESFYVLGGTLTSTSVAATSSSPSPDSGFNVTNNNNGAKITYTYTNASNNVVTYTVTPATTNNEFNFSNSSLESSATLFKEGSINNNGIEESLILPTSYQSNSSNTVFWYSPSSYQMNYTVSSSDNSSIYDIDIVAAFVYV